MADEPGGDRDPAHPVHDAGASAPERSGTEYLRPPSLDDADPAPPPPRPSLSDQKKPPVLRTPPPPWSIKTARALWLLNFLLGAAAIFIAFLSYDTTTAELTVVLGRLSPGYDTEEVASLVDLVYWSSLGGLGVIIASEAALLAVLLNRRRGARWLQLLLLLLHAAVVLMASAFLTVGDWGVIVELLLVAGFLVAFVGWVLCLMPGANRWLRTKDQAEPISLD